MAIFKGLLKNIFVLTPMGIVAIGACHAVQSLVHLILIDTFSLVTMKAQLIPCKFEHLLFFRHVRIMARSAVSSRHRSVQIRIPGTDVLVATIAKPRLRLHHGPEGVLIMTGSTFPLPVGIVDKYCGRTGR